MGSVVISYGVTSIGYRAFSYCDSLVNVTIPDSVTSIGGFAFANSTALESIKFPSGLTEIQSGMFNYCSALTSFTVPDGVTYLRDGVFASCDSLKSLEIPASVTYISYSFTHFCDSLETVYYSGSKSQWKEIIIDTSWGGNDALLGARLICAGVDEPERGGNEFIYETNDDGTSSIVGIATVIIIPEETPNGETVTQIASYSFKEMKNIIVEIPVTIQVIDDCAFYYCSITEIRYSGTVEEWYSISKTDGWWNWQCGGFTVICSDGEIIYS